MALLSSLKTHSLQICKGSLRFSINLCIVMLRILVLCYLLVVYAFLLCVYVFGGNELIVLYYCLSFGCRESVGTGEEI